MDTQTVPTTPATPLLPQIAPVQSAAGGLATLQDIGDLLGPIAERANASLPDPYTQGTQVAEPHYHERAPQQTNRPTNTAPITGQVADVKRARRQNAVAGLANTISQAGNIIQEKKNNKLKDQLTDVMKAKQNIANADAVMKNPASSDTLKQQAQKVLDANKKQLNTILSDPKTQKQMQKALDISFVDPEKNKTPEVQTYQKAMAEFKEAGPFNADNPSEHAVAQAANSPKPQMTDKPNVSGMIPPAPNLQPVPKSQTSYADKALAKDLPSIEVNPQYAPAVKAQQDAQKQLAAVIPKLVDAESKALIQEAKDKNAAALKVFEKASDLQKSGFEAANRMKLADTNNKAAAARVAARNAGEMARVQAEIASREKISRDNRLDKDQQNDVKYGSAKLLDAKILSATTELGKYDALIGQTTADKSLDPKVKAQKLEQLRTEQTIQSTYLDQLQKSRTGLTGLQPNQPSPQVSPQDPKAGTSFWSQVYGNMNQGLRNSTGTNTQGENNGRLDVAKPDSTNIDAVGKDDSDEDSDEQPDNSDLFGNSSSN